MLNRSAESGHLRLDHNLKEKAFCLLPLSMTLVASFLWMSPSGLRKFSSGVAETFIENEFGILSNAASIYMIISFFKVLKYMAKSLSAVPMSTGQSARNKPQII